MVPVLFLPVYVEDGADAVNFWVVLVSVHREAVHRWPSRVRTSAKAKHREVTVSVVVLEDGAHA